MKHGDIEEAMKNLVITIKKLLKESDNLDTRSFIKEVTRINYRLVRINPFIDGKVMYKVGDLGAFDDKGEITCYGRIDNQVKIREILEKQIQCPVILENNVKAFAEAEMLYGVGKYGNNIEEILESLCQGENEFFEVQSRVLSKAETLRQEWKEHKECADELERNVEEVHRFVQTE